MIVIEYRKYLASLKEKLDKGDAPILYFHPESDEGADLVLIDINHWNKILDMLPESDEATNLIMSHSHIDPNEYT